MAASPSHPSPFDFSALVRSEADARRYEPGEVIVTEGEPGDCLFILLDGEVDVSCQGREVARLSPGNLFGEMSVINDEPRSATVRAVIPSRAVAITKKRFLFLTEQTPFFAIHVMRLLSARVRRMNQLT